MFQYISCYSLSVVLLSMLLFIAGFNTSHVTLYLSGKINATSGTLFQYISCYSLSRSLLQRSCLYWFQYISCYSLSLRSGSARQQVLVSIHLMLLFIRFREGDKITFTLFQYISCYSLSEPCDCVIWKKTKFQYISCYSLSSLHPETLPSVPRFNTSHVTLYHPAPPVTVPPNMFQYISCYSLSETTTRDIKALYEFQYISCYSLSRSACGNPGRPYDVSIHLMLLFIMKSSDPKQALNNMFQYISCYSLSGF